MSTSKIFVFFLLIQISFLNSNQVNYTLEDFEKDKLDIFGSTLFQERLRLGLNKDIKIELQIAARVFILHRFYNESWFFKFPNDNNNDSYVAYHCKKSAHECINYVSERIGFVYK